jgi:hypothetical protein
MAIEDYLLRTDPYRATTLTPPWPHPLAVVAAATKITQLVESHKADILDMVIDRGFSTEVHSFHLRVEDVIKPGYPMGDRPQTMLYLCWSGDAPVPANLDEAKDAVVELLASRGISGVRVELFFWYRSFRPSMFAIQPDDPAVPIYNAAKREILTLVKETLNGEWSLMSLVQLGRIKAISIPTIVVFVKPFASHDWADLVTKIKLKLRAAEAAAIDINVEFLPGHLSFLNAPGTSDFAVSCVYSMRADGVPTAGTSITGLAERGIGSLGPFVTLT